MKKRTLIAAALAVLCLGLSSVPAHAVQTARIDIVGAGRVTAPGIDCSRAPGGPLAGDCSELVPDGPDACFPEQDICFPQGGGLVFTAAPAGGFQFTSWSHPQCNPRSLNPCPVVFAPGAVPPPNDVLTITATFTDMQDPTAQVTAPAAQDAVRGTITIKATAGDNAGIPGVTLNAGGRVLAQFTQPPFETTFDTRTVPDGPLQISATARDAANRTGGQTIEVTVDNTNPTLTVTGPDGVTFGPGATPTWTIAANDATSDFGVRCSVVPLGQPAVFGGCTSSTQERLVNPADGRYTLTVRAIDLAGNFAERTKAFAVDTGPPDTTITSGPGDGASTTEGTVSWGLAASEPASTFECRLFLTAIGPGAFGPCSATSSHTVSGLAAGTYTFEARATDVFGNVDPTPARRTVTVVLAAPPAPPAPPPVVQKVIQQVVVVTLTFSFHDANRRTTRLSALTVNSVPAGSTVTATCPKGCAKKRLVKKNAKGSVSLKALAGRRPLKANTRITVTVAKPGAVSAVKVLTIRKSRAPTVKSLCQAAGAKRPGPCA